MHVCREKVAFELYLKIGSFVGVPSYRVALLFYSVIDGHSNYALFCRKFIEFIHNLANLYIVCMAN